MTAVHPDPLQSLPAHVGTVDTARNAQPAGSIRLRDARVARLRSVRPDDAERVQAFVQEGLSAASRRNRFHCAVSGCTPGLLRELTVADGERHVALVATLVEGGLERIVAEARYVVCGADASSGEFAIAVADACRGQGLAERMMQALLASAQEHGLRWLYGEVLDSNQRMLAFMQRMGFRACDAGVWGRRDDGMVRMERAVDAPPRRARRSAGRSVVARWMNGWLARIAEGAGANGIG